MNNTGVSPCYQIKTILWNHCCHRNTDRTPEKKLDSNISENVNTVTNFDETIEEKKEDLDGSLSNSSSGK